MQRVFFQIDLANVQMKTALQKALNQMEGVRQVEIDLGNRSLAVGFTSPANRDSIAGCITDAGFAVLG